MTCCASESRGRAAIARSQGPRAAASLTPVQSVGEWQALRPGRGPGKGRGRAAAGQKATVTPIATGTTKRDCPAWTYSGSG
jgi:hypothetical protein